MLQNTGHLSGLLSIISAMITPAILILATGSLVASTLTRLGRIVDRARSLLRDIREFRITGDTINAALSEDWLKSYDRVWRLRSTISHAATYRGLPSC
jgi:hypothetical protein